MTEKVTMTWAKAIEAAMMRLTKREQATITNDHNGAWRLVCFITCGWVDPAGVTDKAVEHMLNLAADLEVSKP